MRLNCPNCDAQYEVPDEVVPTSGRDVQCSNCGQTWFQHHPDHAPAPEEAEVAVDAPAPDEEVSPPPPPAPPPSKEPPRKELDPAVADILRQEAEAEFEARRRRQSETLESQPDLGLEETEERAPAPQPRPEPAQQQGISPAAQEDDTDRRARDAKDRMARMRGEPEPSSEAAAAAAAISSRRELLPDIEEINSTLRNDNAPSGVDPDAREELGAGGQPKKKRGFRSGFYAALLIFVLLALLYLYAPQIAQTVPALDGFLTGYVGWVDQMRLALDGQIKGMLSWLDAQAVESES
ncbi:MAG: zinc-ribbon domain-containing protein [Sulfitobacter sp.]